MFSKLGSKAYLIGKIGPCSVSVHDFAFMSKPSLSRFVLSRFVNNVKITSKGHVAGCKHRGELSLYKSLQLVRASNEQHEYVAY